jgi:hypothetical protein
MNGVTEIYICKPGQAIKEGKLEHSSTVRTRADALIDSVRRCKADPTIGQITYYAVADGGGFKTLFSYRNAKVRSPRAGQAAGGAMPRTVPATRSANARRTCFLERLLALFGVRRQLAPNPAAGPTLVRHARPRTRASGRTRIVGPSRR